MSYDKRNAHEWHNNPNNGKLRGYHGNGRNAEEIPLLSNDDY